MVEQRVVNEDGTPADGAWHLDKKVPLALVGALLLQTATVGWWAAKMDSRVEALEKQDARTDTLIQQRMTISDQRYESLVRDRDRIVRVEEQIKALLDIVKRIDAKLERTPVQP